MNGPVIIWHREDRKAEATSREVGLDLLQKLLRVLYSELAITENFPVTTPVQWSRHVRLHDAERDGTLDSNDGEADLSRRFPAGATKSEPVTRGLRLMPRL